MNAYDMLDLIGDARGEYLLEAQAYRELQEEPESTRRISFRKGLLIAAILALMLLLVGCTVVYMLSLQEMQVGEHAFTEPAYVNEDGRRVPAETRTSAQVSLQGIYQPALKEWLAFRDSYDPDKALRKANDRNASEVPEPYYTTYGCYTWEMVDRLDEIIRTYDLKLLEPYILVQSWENEILFDALKIDNVHRESANAQVEYGSGYFYPEGTFQIGACITLTESEWSWQNLITLRYSLKEYFDPVSGSIGDIDSYEQWNYTTESGIPVLLAMNEKDAHIYVNLEDAFISIQMNAYAAQGAEQIPMPKEVLQQIADVFDFTVKPQNADLGLVTRMQAAAAAEREAEAAALWDPVAAVIAQGYEAYLEFRMELAEDPEELRYSLYDLNGDGARELILRDGTGYCYEILSVKRGETFLYFDAGAVTANCEIYPCSENRFVLYSEYGGKDRYKFYQAGAEGVSYIVGVTYDRAEDIWYYLPDSDPWTDNDERINRSDALKTINTYPPKKNLGEPKRASEFSREAYSYPEDPYAEHILDSLKREDAQECRYVLLDLNGNDAQELIIEGPLYHGSEKIGTCLSIYSQENGQLLDLNLVVVQYVCKGNVLEYCQTDETGAACHIYYQLTDTGVKTIDILEYDSQSDTWTRDIDGHWGEAAVVITESDARSIIGGYQRLKLDLKPLQDYPLS